MSELNYVRTKLVGVRQVGDGVVITRLTGEDVLGELVLTLEEWTDLVSLAVLFIRRARAEL